MSSIKVTLAVSATPLPAGITFASIRIVATDAAGAAQEQNIDGVSAISAQFDNIADGAGTVVATAIDTDGNAIGSGFTQAFTAPIVATVATFPAPIGLTIEAA